MEVVDEYAHSMVLEGTDPIGIEKWTCTRCRRQLLMDWANNSLTILESGDMNARHIGIKPPSPYDDMELQDIMDAVRKFLESGEYE